MLVVGARGGGGVPGLPLGSVSRYLATHAPCPVVIARQETVAPTREIVVGVRDVRRADAALHFGFTEARLHGAELAVMHGRSSCSGRDSQVEEARAALVAELTDALAPMREFYRGVDVRVEVAGMRPSGLLSAASDRADLLVLGRSAEVRDVRAVTHAVLTNARRPVAIVPDE